MEAIVLDNAHHEDELDALIVTLFREHHLLSLIEKGMMLEACDITGASWFQIHSPVFSPLT